MNGTSCMALSSLKLKALPGPTTSWAAGAVMTSGDASAKLDFWSETRPAAAYTRPEMAELTIAISPASLWIATLPRLRSSQPSMRSEPPALLTSGIGSLALTPESRRRRRRRASAFSDRLMRTPESVSEPPAWTLANESSVSSSMTACVASSSGMSAASDASVIVTF